MKSLSSDDPTTVGPYTLLGRLGEGGMGRASTSPGHRVGNP